MTLREILEENIDFELRPLVVAGVKHADEIVITGIDQAESQIKAWIEEEKLKLLLELQSHVKELHITDLEMKERNIGIGWEDVLMADVVNSKIIDIKRQQLREEK